MDRFRFHKIASQAECLKREQANQHFSNPSSFALERLKLGDSYFRNCDWPSAKSSYMDAVSVLEDHPLSSKASLEYGLSRLAHVHLLLFEIPDALNCFLKSKSLERKRAVDLKQAESEYLMDRIKMARGAGQPQDADYRPGFYTGHMI